MCACLILTAFTQPQTQSGETLIQQDWGMQAGLAEGLPSPLWRGLGRMHETGFYTWVTLFLQGTAPSKPGS